MHEKCIDGCPPFILILSALKTPRYKLEKFLLSILETLTTNKYIVKKTFMLSTPKMLSKIPATLLEA